MAELRNAPTQARSRKTLDAILSSADTLFAERGVSDTTVSQIAEHAGVSIGSLYRFFPNKTALVEEYVRRYAHELLSLMPPSLPESPTLDDLDEIVSGLVDRSVATRINFRGYGSVRQWKDPETGMLACATVHNSEIALVSGLLRSSPYDIDEDQVRRMTTVIVDGVYPLLEGVGDLSKKEQVAMGSEIKAMVSGYIRLRIDPTKLQASAPGAD